MRKVCYSLLLMKKGSLLQYTGRRVGKSFLVYLSFKVLFLLGSGKLAVPIHFT